MRDARQASDPRTKLLVMVGGLLVAIGGLGAIGNPTDDGDARIVAGDPTGCGYNQSEAFSKGCVSGCLTTQYSTQSRGGTYKLNNNAVCSGCDCRYTDAEECTANP